MMILCGFFTMKGRIIWSWSIVETKTMTSTALHLQAFALSIICSNSPLMKVLLNQDWYTWKAERLSEDIVGEGGVRWANKHWMRPRAWITPLVRSLSMWTHINKNPLASFFRQFSLRTFITRGAGRQSLGWSSLLSRVSFSWRNKSWNPSRN